MTNRVKTRTTVRRGTSSQWSTANPILLKGEIGYDSTNNKIKVGDGVKNWNSLGYLKDDNTTYNNATVSADGLMSADDKKNITYYVKGTQTASTNAWTGSLTQISALYEGLTIRYRLPYAGTSTGATLNLTLSGGTTSGAKSIYRYGTTTPITTHFAAGSVITMTYNGTNWIADAFYDSNSYAYVRQYTTTDNATYPVLFSYDTSLPSSYDTKYTRKNSNLTFNPSSGVLNATSLSENGATLSSKYATQDYVNGNFPKLPVAGAFDSGGILTGNKSGSSYFAYTSGKSFETSITDSDAKVPTSKAVKTYVDAAVSSGGSGGGGVEPIDVAFTPYDILNSMTIGSELIITDNYDETFKERISANPYTPLRGPEGYIYTPVQVVNNGDDTNWNYYIYYAIITYELVFHFIIDWYENEAFFDEMHYYSILTGETFTLNDGGEPVIINPLGRFFSISTDTYDGDYITYYFPEKSGTVALLDDIQGGGSVAPIDVNFAFWEVKQGSAGSVVDSFDDTLKNKLTANPNTPLKDRDGNYYYPVSFADWGDEENFSYYIYYYGVYYGATVYFAIDWGDAGVNVDEVNTYSLDKDLGENNIPANSEWGHYFDGTMFTKFKMLITCEEDLSGIEEIEIGFTYYDDGSEYFLYTTPDRINGATVEKIGEGVVLRDNKGEYVGKIPYLEGSEFDMRVYASSDAEFYFTINYEFYN